MGIFSKIGKIFGGIGDIIGGIVGGIVKLVTNVVDGFLGAFGLSFDMPEYDNPSAFQGEQQGILLNSQSAVKGLPIVYGERKIGGTRVYMSTGGDTNQFLYVVIAICEGEIEGFTDLWINDERQQISKYGSDPDLFKTGEALTIAKKLPNGKDSSYYTDKSMVVMEFFTGSDNQANSTFFTAEAPGWDNLHRLRGVAYVACRFEWMDTKIDANGNVVDANPWQGIPQVQFKLRGKKVYTAYVAGNDTDANTSAYESQVSSFGYSNNPADCILDYLRNPRYGKGLNDNRINYTAWAPLKAVFDQTYTLVADPATVSYLVRCDAVINTEDTLFNNTKRLLQSCRGFLPYVDGKYKLKFEANAVPTDAIEITDNMIIGNISIQSADKNSKYNEARITFANEDRSYDSDTLIYKDSDALAEDGEPLILTTSHPSLTNWNRVNQFAKWLVDRSRGQLSVSIKVTNEGQSIVAGDLVRITHQYNRTNAGSDITDYLFKAPTTSDSTIAFTSPDMMFRVVSTKLNYDNTVDLQLLEHNNVIYGVLPMDPVGPPKCQPGYMEDENGNCVLVGGGDPPPCDEGEHWDYDLQKCVPDAPDECDEGWHWDPSLDKCVPDTGPGEQSPVKCSSGNYSAVASWVEWEISMTGFNTGIITVHFALNSPADAWTGHGSNIEQKVVVTQYRETVTIRVTSVRGTRIRPGDYVAYRVFLSSAMMAGDMQSGRIDNLPGGHNQDSYCTVPPKPNYGNDSQSSTQTVTQGF